MFEGVNLSGVSTWCGEMLRDYEGDGKREEDAFLKLFFIQISLMPNTKSRQAAVPASAPRGGIVPTPPNTTPHTQVDIYTRWTYDGVGKVG